MSKIFILFLVSIQLISSQTVLDSLTNNPVSYATISFGNGNGIFADDDGNFLFTKKLYPDIDSLFISALGYKDINISTKSLPEKIFMLQQADQLDEIVIGFKPNRKFKIEKLKPYLDDDYYNCWLPTIESEIAVFFPNYSNKDQEIASVTFPIALESRDWKKRNKSNSDKKKFSTLFKVKFYRNDNNLPGKALTLETIVFRATEKDGDAYKLNLEGYNLEVPKNGFFVSLQVLGYTDKNGKLLPNKKYKEIQSPSGTVKIPTNFRPLLPFTDKVTSKNTLIKRVFINGNNWIKFDKNNGFKSSLLDKGLFNYGIGVEFKTYKDE